MPRFRITRMKPTASPRACSNVQQVRIVEIVDGQSFPAGAEPVDPATELSDWADVVQE